MKLNTSKIITLVAAVLSVFIAVSALAGTKIQYTIQPIITVNVKAPEQISDDTAKGIVNFIQQNSKIKFGNIATSNHAMNLNGNNRRIYSIRSPWGSGHSVTLKAKLHLSAGTNYLNFYPFNDGHQDTQLAIAQQCVPYTYKADYKIPLQYSASPTPVKFSYSVNLDYRYDMSHKKYYTAIINNCSLTV